MLSGAGRIVSLMKWSYTVTDNRSAELSPLVSREQAENAFRDAMRLFVGAKRLYTVKQLAKGIRLPKKDDGEQITKPLYDFLSYPSGHPDHRPLHMGLQLSIIKFLGAEFTTEWLGLAGQGAFDLPDADDPDPGALAVENSDDNATVTRAAINGEFEPHEHRDLKVVGTRMMSRGAKLVAIARAA